jgi:glycerol-3-phosphate dehydrogenase
MNGAEVSLNTLSKAWMSKTIQLFSVKTNRGTIYPKVVVNAAGVYSDVIANMAEDQFFTSTLEKAPTASSIRR